MTVRKLIQMCNYVIETGRLLLIVKVSKPSANLKNTFFFYFAASFLLSDHLFPFSATSLLNHSQ